MAFDNLDLEGDLKRLVEDATKKRFEGVPQPTVVEPRYLCFLCLKAGRRSVMLEDTSIPRDERWFYCEDGHGHMSVSETYARLYLEKE